MSLRSQMFAVMVNQISGIDKLAADVNSLSTDAAVRTLAEYVKNRVGAVGRIFEDEENRFMETMSKSHVSAPPGLGYATKRNIMEFKVIQGLKIMSGDKGSFRQWHQKVLSAVGQVEAGYERLLQELAQEVDLGRNVDKILEEMEAKHSDFYLKTSNDMRKLLIDKVDGGGVREDQERQGRRGYEELCSCVEVVH
jgi:hypothetical protein